MLRIFPRACCFLVCLLSKGGLNNMGLCQLRTWLLSIMVLLLLLLVAQISQSRSLIVKLTLQALVLLCGTLELPLRLMPFHQGILQLAVGAIPVYLSVVQLTTHAFAV